MSDEHKADEPVSTQTGPLHGILAEYETPTALVNACKRVRDAGFKKWDTYTPFPVHGIDRAMGIQMTSLPWLVLVAALLGLGTAISFQWWTNAVDYKFISSGKPMWSIPANVPIYFELTVLFSAFAALFGMLALNNLPHPSHPLDHKKHFGKVTDDRFFLYIEAEDEKFERDSVQALLEETHPASLEEVPEDHSTPAELPRKFVYALIILGGASLIPFGVFAKMRASKNVEPRIHAIGDMDWQAKFQAQQPNPLFPNGMAMRAPEPGTVAAGEPVDDDHFATGKTEGQFARTFPAAFKIDDAAMARGKQRFEIFCAPCHGQSGAGDGMVAQRASELAQGTWVPPTNLGLEYLQKMPVGQLYDAISNGVRNMPAYGPQISPEDRWAIVLYLRALQKSKGAPVTDLNPTERAALK
ncbi:MAG: quinol:electron acceptor oxidoreductase subunit ActD [Polyangiaceae bacterium]